MSEADKKRGLYPKYRVERIDGEPMGDAIVLEFDDPNAQVGIAAFAKAVRADGYESLAVDLQTKLIENSYY